MDATALISRRIDYPSASVWLADYIISQSLAANFAAQQPSLRSNR
jgi:hypothetical protein